MTKDKGILETGGETADRVVELVAEASEEGDLYDARVVHNAIDELRGQLFVLSRFADLREQKLKEEVRSKFLEVIASVYEVDVSEVELSDVQGVFPNNKGKVLKFSFCLPVKILGDEIPPREFVEKMRADQIDLIIVRHNDQAVDVCFM